MGLGHVGGHGGMATGLRMAAMTSHSLTLMEDLDRGGGQAHLHFLPHQGIRDRVVMVLDINVIIDIDSRFFPLREHVRFDR